MKVFLTVATVLCFTAGAYSAPQQYHPRQFYPTFNRQQPAALASDEQAVYSRPPRQNRGGNPYQGGGGGGPGASVECQRQEVGPGQFKFNCAGVNQEQITLRNEHILWLTSDGSGPQVLDIEVPNYKINELIKAGYKTSAGGSTKINVLLRRPEQTADAEVDVPKSSAGQTSVNLQYEQPSNQLVHYPNDKPYRPLSGPILPPLAGGRGRREVDFIGVDQQRNYYQ